MRPSRVRQLFRVFIGMLLILSVAQVFPLEEPLIHPVEGESVWVQTSENDFNSGDEDNVTITSGGTLILESTEEYIEDDFYNASMISYMENVRINSSGNQVELIKFNKTFGTGNDDFGRDGMQTPDGGYIICASYNDPSSSFDLWLIKLNETGDLQWENKIGGDEADHCFSFRPTTDGGYIGTGSSSSYTTAYSDVWLVKTDSMGNEQWNRTFGDDRNDVGYDVKQTADGGYIIAGETQNVTSWADQLWLIRTDDMGLEQWNKTFGIWDEYDHGKSVQQTSDGGYIVAGITASYGAGADDIWLIKTDSTGNEQWNKTFGGDDDDRAYSMLVTPDGGYIIVGETETFGLGGNFEPDVWLIKTDSSGIEQWNRTYHYNVENRGQSIEQTADGGYIILGYTGTVGWEDYSKDVLLIKTNNIGDEEWNMSTGGVDLYDAGISVNQTTDGGYLLVCRTKSYGTGKRDVWILKVNETGVYDFTSGILTSTNLPSGIDALSPGNFRFETTIPNGTGISVQFSQDTLTWYSSIGVLNGWDELQDGTGNIDLSSLGWDGTNFYYQAKFTSDNDNHSILHNINVTYLQYVHSGTFISESFDAGGDVVWDSISWNVNLPQNTNISFQIRTATSESGLSSQEFVGPGGSPSSNYTSSPSNIWSGHGTDKWIQYKIYMNTTNQSFSPILYDVTIQYNRIPGGVILIYPAHDIWLNNNTPSFTWSHNDSDGTQTEFQVLIDDEIGFSSIDFDCGQQTSTEEQWQFPSGTSYTTIPDGTWYWKVRTKDEDGVWGPYGNNWMFNIDTMPPVSFTPTADPAGWTSDTQPTITFETTDADSGVDYYNVSIGPGAFSTQISPYTLPSLSNGIHNITVRAYDVAGNFKVGYVDAQIDTVLPTITHIKVEEGEVGENMNITAIVTDDHSGVKNVTLFYKKTSELDYVEQKMTGYKDMYFTEIYGAAVTSDGISYYLKAEDSVESPNTIYFGIDGQTSTEPNLLTDIDITVTVDEINPWVVTRQWITHLSRVHSRFPRQLQEDFIGMETKQYSPRTLIYRRELNTRLQSAQMPRIWQATV
jgi:hypothetical protein